MCDDALMAWIDIYNTPQELSCSGNEARLGGAPICEQIGNHGGRWSKKLRNRNIRREWNQNGVLLHDRRYRGYD